jgi:hypothetical protein
MKKLIVAVLAGLVLLFLSHAANAATKAWYVHETDLKVRAKPNSYILGRLYQNERMDIQDIDSNGWGYGYAYGQVNRCVWVQFSGPGVTYFTTHGTVVSTRCRTTNRYLALSEFTNGQIWGEEDGEFHTLSKETHMWDNWLWGGRWGNHRHRGKAPAGSLMKIRYTTNDGVGVMARPCVKGANGKLDCLSDWIFIERATL